MTIEAVLAAGMAGLEAPYRSWVEAHLIPPRPIQVQLDHSTGTPETMRNVVEKRTRASGTPLPGWVREE